MINVIVVLLLGWISYMKSRNLKEAFKMENQMERIMLHTEKIRSVIVRMDSDAKGYFISGDPKYLQTYNRNAFSIGKELEYLNEVGRENDHLKKSTAQLEALIDAKIEFNSSLMEIRRLSAVENKDVIPVTEDIRSTNKINQLITDIQNNETASFQDATAKNESAGKMFEIAFNTLIILSILLLIAVYFIIRHHLKGRKTSELLLEKSQQLLQSIIDNTTNPIFVKQISGQYLLVNKQFERMFHYTTGQVAGKTDHQLFSKEIADKLWSSDLEVVKSGKEMQTEEKFTFNSELHTYLMVKFPIRDNDGKIYAIGGIATDITDRTKSDIQVKESEAEISGIFNAAPEALIVVNEEGSIVRWNSKAEIVFGWKAAEVIGKQMNEIILPDKYKDLPLKGIRSFLRTGESALLNKTIEIIAHNKRKEQFDVELTISYIYQDGKYFFISFLRDITKKKQLEKESKQSQAFLNSIIENIPDMIFVKHFNGQYLLVNKEFEQLFHFTNEQLKGKTDHQIFPREIADILWSHHMEVIQTEKEIQTEEQFSNGSEVRTYAMVKFPIMDHEGKIYAVGGIASDISERKKLDTQLKNSEEQTSGIFNAAPESVIVINEEGNIVKWNARSETLFGWEAREVLGKPMHEIIMPVRFREMHVKGLKRFLETGEGPILNKTIELFAINRKKEEFEIELKVSYIQQEGKYLFIAFLRDITKRKQLEKAMKESQSFLNSIFENIPDMIVVKDARDLRFVRLNPAGEKLLGYSAAELIGKSDYDLFPKEQAAFFTSKDKETLESGAVLDIPEEAVDAKKRKLWLHTKKITIRDEKGDPAYLLGISEDITEKKWLEDEKKATERAMRESEQRMKSILENIGEGVVVSDSQKKVLLYNRMAEDILGIDETEELFDWSDKYDIFYPDGISTFPAQDLPLEKALRNEPVDDMELVLKDPVSKKTKKISVTGRPIKDKNNRIRAAVVTIRDITKYKELEKALHESETKYRNLIGFKMSSKKDE